MLRTLALGALLILLAFGAEGSSADDKGKEGRKGKKAVARAPETNLLKADADGAAKAMPKELKNFGEQWLLAKGK
jgi:hypothetical protein